MQSDFIAKEFEWCLIKVLLCEVLERVDMWGFLLATELYSFKVMFGKA